MQIVFNIDIITYGDFHEKVHLDQTTNVLQYTTEAGFQQQAILFNLER